MDNGLLTLASLLLPAASFLLLALVAPLRRSGRFAGYVSALAAALSLESKNSTKTRLAVGSQKHPSEVFSF